LEGLAAQLRARVVLTLVLVPGVLAGCEPSVASTPRHAVGATTVELGSRPSADRAPSLEAASPGPSVSMSTPPALAFAPWPGASGPLRLVYVRAAWSAAALDVERSGLFESVAVRELARPFSAVLLDVTDVDAQERQSTLVELGVRDVPSVVLEGCGAGGGRANRRVLRVLDQATVSAALEGCLAGDDRGPP
jgi:hypothetical protein